MAEYSYLFKYIIIGNSSRHRFLLFIGSRCWKIMLIKLISKP